MHEKEALEMKATLESKGEIDFHVCTLGKTVSIKKNMVSISMEKKKEHQRVFTPSVIEPSFGIGRIIYCLFEHSFYMRPSKAEDEQLNVFGFPPLVAPIKCTVFPLIKTQKFDDAAKIIAKSLTAVGISHIVDITGMLVAKNIRFNKLGLEFLSHQRINILDFVVDDLYVYFCTLHSFANSIHKYQYCLLTLYFGSFFLSI